MTNLTKYVMKKLQRGSTLKLSFSVMRLRSDVSEIATQPIDIDDKALVVMTFKGISNTNNLQLEIRMKKNDGIKIETVPLTISVGEIEEEFVCCSNTWVVAKRKDISAQELIEYNIYNRYTGATTPEYTLLYSFEVTITIQVLGWVADLMTIPSFVMNHLHENTEFTDFQLKATDGAVPVHKAVVTAHSDMIKTMLKGEEWTETKEGSIEIKNVTVKTLQHLKDYMYLGILPDEDLESLLLVASYYLMDKLKNQCIAKLVKIVKPDDLGDLVEFACQHNMPDLMKAVLLLTADDTVTGAYKSMLN